MGPAVTLLRRLLRQTSKEYCVHDKNGCLDEFKNGAVSGPPGNWMEPDPVRQTVWFGDSATQTAATLSTLRTATAANAASAVAAWRGSLNNTHRVLWSNSAEKNSQRADLMRHRTGHPYITGSHAQARQPLFHM